jgi:excisionase family DNA binding protein
LSQEELPRLLDIGGIAEHLGVTERHVRRLVAERRIPFVKWGHLLRFDPDEIASWLDSVRVPPTDGVVGPANLGAPAADPAGDRRPQRGPAEWPTR